MVTNAYLWSNPIASSQPFLLTLLAFFRKIRFFGPHLGLCHAFPPRFLLFLLPFPLIVLPFRQWFPSLFYSLLGTFSHSHGFCALDSCAFQVCFVFCQFWTKCTRLPHGHLPAPPILCASKWALFLKVCLVRGKKSYWTWSVYQALHHVVTSIMWSFQFPSPEAWDVLSCLYLVLSGHQGLLQVIAAASQLVFMRSLLA